MTLAGPFCPCCDYSCPASVDPTRDCVNRDDDYIPAEYDGQVDDEDA